MNASYQREKTHELAKGYIHDRCPWLIRRVGLDHRTDSRWGGRRDRASSRASDGAVSAGTSDTRRGGVPGAPDGVLVAVPGSPASLDTGSDHLTESRRDRRRGRDSGACDVTHSGVAAAGTSAASHGGRPVGLGGTLPPASCGPLVLTAALVADAIRVGRGPTGLDPGGATRLSVHFVRRIVARHGAVVVGTDAGEERLQRSEEPAVSPEDTAARQTDEVVAPRPDAGDGPGTVPQARVRIL